MDSPRQRVEAARQKILELEQDIKKAEADILVREQAKAEDETHRRQKYTPLFEIARKELAKREEARDNVIKELEDVSEELNDIQAELRCHRDVAECNAWGQTDAMMRGVSVPQAPPSNALDYLSSRIKALERKKVSIQRQKNDYNCMAYEIPLTGPNATNPYATLQVLKPLRQRERQLQEGVESSSKEYNYIIANCQKYNEPHLFIYRDRVFKELQSKKAELKEVRDNIKELLAGDPEGGVVTFDILRCH